MSEEFKLELIITGAILALGVLMRIIVKLICLLAGGWSRSMRDRRFAAIFFPGIALAVFAVVLIASGIRCADIDEDIERLAQRDVGRYTLDAVMELDERIEKEGRLGSLFLKNGAELDALRLRIDAYIDAEAQELTARIDELESFEAPETYSAYESAGKKIDSLRIKSGNFDIYRNSDRPFCEELERRVPNYDIFLDYEAEYARFAESVKDTGKCWKCDGVGKHGADCPDCNAAGWVKAQDGVSDIRCGSCPYPGRITVDCENCENGFVRREG